MPISLSLGGITATSARLTLGGVSASASQVQIQYADRQDFQFTTAPMPRTSVVANLLLEGLNQAGRYFVRARELAADGTPAPWSNVVGFTTPAAAQRDLTPAAVMIEPAVVVVPEPVVGWYSPSEEQGYPARALGRDDPMSQFWARRASGMFAVEMQTVGGSVDTLALLETNAPEDATVTIKADRAIGSLRGASPAFVYGPVPFRASALLPQRRGYHGLWRLAEAQTFPLWRIEIQGRMPGDLFAATYAVLGQARQTKNYAVDSKSETILDTGTIERDRSGNPTRVSGHRGRKVEFEVQHMLEADYEAQYERIRWLVGITDPVLVIPNSKPGAFLHDRILFGQLGAGRATNSFSPRFSQGFSVTSLI